MAIRFLLCAALLLPLPLLGQDPPRVHVIATGGTISNLGQGGRLTGEALVEGLPGAERIARVSVEQFSNVASGAITLEQWLALSARINGLFREDPALAGVVVTHGTDTMEETAYFLDLTVGDCRPIVVTGAMRQASAIGADGPANLFNSLRFATDPAARGAGAVVLLDDAVFRARDVAKVNTSRVEAFEAPDAGPLAIADGDRIDYLHPHRPRDCGRPVYDLSGLSALPRVDVVYSYLGADGALVRAAVAAGAKGIVIAGVGRGGSTPGQSAAIREAVEKGVFVVRSSRTGSGRVPVDREDLDDWQPGRGAIFGADDLNPQKARVLLMLALTRTSDARELAREFETR